MLLIYFDKQALSETERQACYVESTQLAHEIKSSGQYLAANPLHPTAMATAVRVRDGQRFVTDGPFAETREQLGGYFLIDAKRFDVLENAGPFFDILGCKQALPCNTGFTHPQQPLHA